MSIDHPLYSAKTLKAITSLHKRLPKKTEALIRGCLVVMNRVCGGKNCRCTQGYKHRSLYLSRSFKGKLRMVYIPRHAEEEVKKGVMNYRKTIALLDRLSAIHFKRLKQGSLP